MRIYIPLFLACLFANQYTFAQCTPAFSVTPDGYSLYTFQATQAEVAGYTYDNSWNINGTSTNIFTSSLYYNFNSPGTYSVCHYITIQDSNSVTVCIDSSCQFVTIAPSCIPQFYAQASVSAGTTCQFTNTLTNYNNLLISWSYGDSTYATGIAAPIHTYPAYGIYHYCFYATDTINHCTDSSCNSVSVDSQTVICNLESWINDWQPAFTRTDVIFTNLRYYDTSSTYTIWSFGDGASVSANSDSVMHTYPGYGQYMLTVTDTDTVTHCSYHLTSTVIVDSCQQGYDSFMVDTVMNTPFSVYVDPYFNQWGSISFVWNYGDGSPLDSSDFTGMHTYTASGTYGICFTTHFPGCPSEQSCDTITVSCNLDADFEYTQITDTSVSYTPLVTLDFPSDPNVVFMWNFGDGLTSTEEYPIHVYANTGTFNTCLIVTDTLHGCSDTLCGSISYLSSNDTICGTIFADWINQINRKALLYLYKSKEAMKQIC